MKISEIEEKEMHSVKIESYKRRARSFHKKNHMLWHNNKSNINQIQIL